MSSSKETVSVVGEAGFSLLEVIIALAILMTVLISVSSLMVTAFKVGANSRYRQVATELATSTLDNEVQTGATTLLTKVGDSSLPTVTSAGQDYIMEMEVSPYYPGTSACASPSSSTGAMLKVTVWATWADETSGSTWWVSGSSTSTGLLVEETTLLPLPPTAFNGNDGSILVDIVGATGIGVQGVTVTATYSGTTYTTTTGESGCALFANLSPHTWTITGSKSGYIDDLDDWSTTNNSASPLSSSQAVLADTTDTVNWVYDEEATVTPTYTVSASGSWLPIGISSMPLTFYSNYTPWNSSSGSSTSYEAATPALVFPFTATSSPPPSYYVVAGTCGIDSAPDGASFPGAETDGQPVNLTPGGQAAPVFALTPVYIVVETSTGYPSGASVTATTTDPNCATGTLAMPSLNLGTSCIPGASCATNLAYRRKTHAKHPGAILVGFGNTNTTTTLSSSATSAVYGQSLTLTATAGRSGSGAITVGSFTFTEGGTSSTSSTLTQSITASSTTTAVTSSASSNSSVVGAAVTFTAAVTAASGATPVGTVTFTANGSAIAACSTPVALVSGSATCTTSALAAGSDAIEAVFTPTVSTNFVTSNGTTTQYVYSTTGTASIVTGLPYGIWILTPSYNGTTGTPVTVTVKPSGVYIGGTLVTGYITLVA